MKHLIVIAAMLLALSSTADARPRHSARAHHHHHRAHHETQISQTETPTGYVSPEARPRECYGIAWCGCWLRIQKGITDTGANLAAWWRHWGHRVDGPVVGAVAYMHRRGGSGHVGIVTGVDANGNPIIKSGNHNHAVGTGVYPKQRIVEYRM